jgi:hypothetical protein
VEAGTFVGTTPKRIWRSCLPMNMNERGQMAQRYDVVLAEPPWMHYGDEVQERIDALYPHASKLELFPRRCREGWDTIGNELDRFQ